MQKKARLLGVAAGLAAATLAAGTAFAETAPSYQEFADSTHVDTDGQYIVNGDEPVANNGELRQYYDVMVKEPKRTSSTELIINTVRGRDDKWSATQAKDLRYCVSTKFGADHGRMVTAMANGAALWENASSGIDYVYVPSADASCTTSNKSVVFSVEPVETSQYIARAFFPSTRKRNVLVDNSIWTSGSWSPANIMGHELGHTLGFRHEHTRPESGTCFEDNNWRPLTPYDSASIMHYPQCNGSSNDLSMTATDAAGARAVYGN
ncbi:peptidase M16 [Nocardioides speluncae]|uniref:peptidase M16 n=1 Tax=Nocardioides speluncae TaxID=2670337 RepID=UPI000D697A0E|nr:peptidase M16 [Nocardioides speluncae]